MLSPKTGSEAKMSPLTMPFKIILNLVCLVSSTAQEKEIKGIEIGSKEVKLSLQITHLSM